MKSTIREIFETPYDSLGDVLRDIDEFNLPIRSAATILHDLEIGNDPWDWQSALINLRVYSYEMRGKLADGHCSIIYGRKKIFMHLKKESGTTKIYVPYNRLAEDRLPLGSNRADGRSISELCLEKWAIIALKRGQPNAARRCLKAVVDASRFTQLVVEQLGE